jgi:protein-S-isoprenylcysteine O-methyltransferase Ste14
VNDIQTLNERVDRRRVAVRRSPRYARFMFTGTVFGAVFALVVACVSPSHPDIAFWQVFGILFVMMGAVGLGLGALLAVVLDHTVYKRSQTVVAERERIRRTEDTD